MNRILADPRLRALGLLWLTQFFVAGVSSGPLLLALSGSSDKQLSAPGGLLFLEMLRLRQSELTLALKEGLELLILGEVLLLAVRAALTKSIAEPLLGPVDEGGRWKIWGTYWGLSLMLYFATASLIMLGARVFLWSISNWDGSLQFGAIAPSALSLVLLLLAQIVTTIVFDSARVSAFSQTNKTIFGRLRCLRSMWLQHLGILLLGRFAVVLIRSFALALSFRFFIAPQGTPAAWPLTSGLANQILVLLVLSSEALWLQLLATKLAPLFNLEPIAHGDTAASAAAPNDPRPNPGASLGK